MPFTDLLSSNNFIQSTRGYWFVRTDSGDNFEPFTEGGFIGIGWNQISIDDIENATSLQLKSKIAESERIDSQNKKGKSKITGIYNKLLKFKNLAKGDIVIIPSRGSSRLAFGLIEDDMIYTDLDRSFSCDYYKRRKVKWIKIMNMRDLDPKFFQIIVSQHAISKIEKYADYIDPITNTLYFKEGSGNLVFDVRTSDDINVLTLISLIQSLQTIENEINTEFQLNENVDEASIKLNVQSPGKIVIKIPTGQTLLFLVSLLIISGCTGIADNAAMPNLPQTQRDGIQHVIDANQDSIQNINTAFDTLEIDRDKFNQILGHGSN